MQVAAVTRARVAADINFGPDAAAVAACWRGVALLLHPQRSPRIVAEAVRRLVADYSTSTAARMHRPSGAVQQRGMLLLLQLERRLQRKQLPFAAAS